MIKDNPINCQGLYANAHTGSEQFTDGEFKNAALLCELAARYVCIYAEPGDRPAAQIAVLRRALELAGGSCNADRLAALESEHHEVSAELVKLREALV